MAKEVQSKKRKASVPVANAEKMKKVKKASTEASAVEDKKRKAAEESAPFEVKKSKKPKQSLEDELGSKPPKEVTLDKAPKKTNVGDSNGANGVSKNFEAAKATKTKESKQSQQIERRTDSEDDNEDTDESEIDDQTDALLKGFESDGDEEDAVKEGGLQDGEEVPQVPDLSNRSKKQLQRAADFKKDEKPGVVYVGRIPHGFYEHEMREYFKQFGKILKLRLSRNRRTGASRHIAWIQFESATVAGIVAKTMDNYLLFNHILKVKVVPDEQVPSNLWKGANRRFKKVPWNKMEGRKLAEPKSEDAWGKLNAREQRRREKKAEKLKAIGYEFESPKLKSPKGVSKKPQQRTVANEQEVGVEAIEAAPPSEVTGSKNKTKNDKKLPVQIEALEASEKAISPVVDVEIKTKEKKKKKRKIPDLDDGSTTIRTITPVEPVEEVLKSKKSKTDVAGATEETSKGKAKKSQKQKEAKAA